MRAGTPAVRDAPAARPRDGLSLADVERARQTIRGHVRRTAVEPSPVLSEEAGARVHLKLEHHQITGSFKLRGAVNAVFNLTERQKARGVVGAPSAVPSG